MIMSTQFEASIIVLCSEAAQTLHALRLLFLTLEEIASIARAKMQKEANS